MAKSSLHVLKQVTLDEPSEIALKSYMATYEVQSPIAAIRGILTEWGAANPMDGAIVAAANRAHNEMRMILLERVKEFFVQMREAVELVTTTGADAAERVE